MDRLFKLRLLLSYWGQQILIWMCAGVSVHSLAAPVTGGEPIAVIHAPDRNNPTEVQLGKKLFHDKRLSSDNSVACSSCHRIADGGDDGMQRSPGVNNKLGEINTPTVLNSALNFVQFWDGRADSLADQVPGPIHNPLEMGSNWQQVLEKLLVDEDIVSQFGQIYSNGLTQENIVRAIVAYEEQLLTTNSPFDRYLLGEEAAISEQAKIGYAEFKRLGCASCHQGRNVGGNMFQVMGVMGNYVEDRGEITTADLGRFNVTGDEADKYKFKVPSLRNVAETSPYFHDGSAATLEEAVRIMSYYQLGRPVSEIQIKNLVSFLKTLSGELREELL